MTKRKIIYTLLTVLGIIILVNIQAARDAKKWHLVSSIPTGLIDGYVASLNKGYDSWFIGNSTLANGVLEDTVEKKTGRSIVKMPMGSATGQAMCMLAVKSINTVKKLPSEICLFLTKDDFNEKGLRGETSVSYIKAMEGKAFKERVLSSLPLYSYRINLKKRYAREIKRIMRGKREKIKKVDAYKPVDSTKVKVSPIDETHSSHLINLGKNFTLNIKGFKELAKVCKEKGIKLHVYFPPVTKSVPNWQNYYYPKMTYNAVFSAVESELKADGIPYTDYSAAMPSTTLYFKDEYHLNPHGAVIFTNMLVSDLKNGK